MKKKKSLVRRRKMVKEASSQKYKVIDYKYGREIEFSAFDQPISMGDLKKIIKKEFSDHSEDDLLILVFGPCSLIIGTPDQ